MRVRVHNLEMRDQRVVKVLEEQHAAVECVEGDAIGELDHVELRFLGEDIIDVRFEERELAEELGAEVALDGGFELGFLRGGDAAAPLARA